MQHDFEEFFSHHLLNGTLKDGLASPVDLIVAQSLIYFLCVYYIQFSFGCLNLFLSSVGNQRVVGLICSFLNQNAQKSEFEQEPTNIDGFCSNYFLDTKYFLVVTW